jgi:hypothetical protein
MPIKWISDIRLGKMPTTRCGACCVEESGVAELVRLVGGEQRGEGREARLETSTTRLTCSSLDGAGLDWAFPSVAT